MKKIVFIAALSIALTGCNENTKELERLKKENNALKNQIISLNNEAPRQLHTIKSLAANKNLNEAKEKLQKLKDTHPSSQEVAIASEIVKNLAAEIAESEKNKALLKKKNEIKKQNALKNLKKTVDKISGITWYVHKNQPTNEKYIAAYIGIKDDSEPFLRTYIYYYASDWLFVKDCTFHIDGKNHYMKLNDFKRDNSDGYIWEWSDTLATAEDIETLKKIANSKDAYIRFNGSNYKFDYEVEIEEKRQLREILLAFESISEQRK